MDLWRPVRATARLATPDRRRVYPRLLLAMTAVGYLLSMLLGRGLLDANGTVIGGDFAAFYTAGQMVSRGRQAELYDLPAQRRLQDALSAPQRPSDVHPFVSPPFTALLFLPLAQLPYLWAVAVWWALGLLALWLHGRWTARGWPGLVGPGPARYLLLAAAFPPTIAWFYYGQTTVFSLLLLTGFAAALREGRGLLAGLCVGLMVWKPQLALGPGLILLGHRCWSGAAVALAVGAAWGGVGLLLLPAQMSEYWHLSPRLLEFLRSPDYPRWGLVSLYGFFQLLLGDVAGRLATLLGLGTSALGYLALIAVVWRGPGPGRDLRLSAALTVSLLASPHLFYYDTQLLLVPLVLAFAALWPPAATAEPTAGSPAELLLGSAVLLCLAVLVGPRLASALQEGLRGAHLPVMVPQLATLAMLLFAASAWRLARDLEGSPAQG